MKIKPTIILFILVSLLASCSSLPSRDVMIQKTQNISLPAAEKSGYGIVYVLRPTHLGSLIRFNIFLDSKEDAAEIGFNRGHQYIYFYAKPGGHYLYSKAEDWDMARIYVKEGTPVFVKQVASFGFIMAKNSLQIIDELEAKYHFQDDLNLGTINNSNVIDSVEVKK